MAVPVSICRLDLRHCLTAILADRGREMTVSELVGALAQSGLTTDGRPGKVVSDVLRSECRAGRVIRTGRGRYRLGVVPRSTMYRIRSRAAALGADPIGARRYF